MMPGALFSLYLKLQTMPSRQGLPFFWAMALLRSDKAGGAAGAIREAGTLRVM